MRRPVHATLALLLMGAVAQSCVLEPLEANRVAEGGSGGASAGSDAKAGRAGSPSGVAGTDTGAGASQGGIGGKAMGGAPGAGAGVGGGGSAGSGGGASEAGAAGEPAVDWIRCDPTFAYDAYAECPTLQPEVGTACDDDIFYPEDFCAYCQRPEACPVETEYVVLRCVNRSWRPGSVVFGVGCCPDARPTHGDACDSNAFCEYGLSNVCECIDSKWQCCPDAFDGAACNMPGQQCIVSYSAIDADKCSCNGANPNTAVWSCCPYFTPFEGDICYYENVTCMYPDQTCTCAAYGSNWSCE